MVSTKVSILYLSAGSGHQVAAESLADAMRLGISDISIIVEDPFSRAMKFLPLVLGTLQAATSLLVPNLYDTAWRRMTIKNTPIGNLYLLQNFLLEELKNHASNVIVSTHVMPCILVNKLKRAKKINNTKHFGVLTDYGVNPLLPTEGMDGYFVAHDELCQSLVDRGVDPDIIHVTGIPIRPSFNRQPAATDSNQLRVLIMAGGIRSGGYVKVKNQVTQILHSLDGLDPSKLNITIVTGNQPRLEQELGKLARESRYRLNVRGFVNNMEDLMLTHDILVAKPGGLIVAEALSSGIPFILSQPGPGVETANMEFLVRHGVAMRGETAHDIIESLRFCIENPEAVHRMKLEARNLGFPNSSEMITNHILNNLSRG